MSGADDLEVVLSVLWPERLAERPQRGVRVAETWRSLVRWISRPVTIDRKADAGGFVLADLRDGVRKKDHVVSVSCLAIDHDDGTTSMATIHEALGRYAHVVFCTHSSTPESPRWRAIIAYTRPVSAEEHAIIWRHVTTLLAAAGIEVDVSTKDPARLWYAPARRPGAAYEVLTGDGEALDVDEVLRVARECEAEAQAARAAQRAPVASGERYEQAAVRRACEAVASAPPGTRNSALNREAYALARLAITNAVIAEALVSAALAAGLSHHEATRTIESALRARRGVA